MKEGHVAFTVGDIACLAVSDGALDCGPPDVPAQVLFADAPPAEVEAAIRASGEPLPWTHWAEEMTCLVVDTGAQRILLDTGAGELDPGTGRLAANLAGAGVAATDIDAVIVTHGHPDHIGGLLGRDGTPAFPNARVLLSREEWRFWMRGGAERALPAEEAAFFVELASRTFRVVEDRLEIVDGEARPFAGVRCLPTPGHTPGHLAVEVSSRGERLLAVGDLVIHPVHVTHPEWHCVFDADAAVLAQTRRSLFAAAGASLVQAFHFPFPGLGRLTEVDGDYEWADAR